MSDAAVAKKNRAAIRTKVTNNFNSIPDFHTWSLVNLKSLKKNTSDWQAKLNQYDPIVQKAIHDDPNQADSVLDSDIEKANEYQEKLTEIMTAIDNLIVPAGSTQHLARSLLRNPQIPLPEYWSKDGEDLQVFFNQFEAVTDKFCYSDFDKLKLLTQQIKGRASKLLEGLDDDQQTYHDAKKYILEARGNKKLRKHATIKKIANMKLKSSDDPYDYIKDMKLTKQNVASLNISVDDFLEYFFWNGLNEDFQSHIVTLTKQTRPDLKDIIDNFFEANERYEVINKKRSEEMKQAKATSLAIDPKPETNTNRNANFKPCSICSKLDSKEADHPIFKCSKFSDSKKRVDKLKELNGCVKCSNLNHTEKDCRHRFNTKCRSCFQWHFTFLCVEPEKSDENSEPSEEKPNSTVSASSQMAYAAALMTNCGENEHSATSTFTCMINYYYVRALKDSGSSVNLISDRLADTLKLETVEKVDFALSGVNTVSNYEARKVKFLCKIGDFTHELYAMTVPNLTCTYNYKDLYKIVRIFKEKGFDFCDKMLSEHSDDIPVVEFLLGSCSHYCIPEEEVAFGPTGTSIYGKTSFGIFIKGSIPRMLEDLSHLLPANVYGSACLIPDCRATKAISCLSSSANSAVTGEGDARILPSEVTYTALDSQGDWVESELAGAPAEA